MGGSGVGLFVRAAPTPRRYHNEAARDLYGQGDPDMKRRTKFSREDAPLPAFDDEVGGDDGNSSNDPPPPPLEGSIEDDDSLGGDTLPPGFGGNENSGQSSDDDISDTLEQLLQEYGLLKAAVAAGGPSLLFCENFR